MFRHGPISTETDKKPFIFTVIAFAASLTAAVLLFVLGKGNALSIIAGIFVSIVALSAGGVLLALITDRAYVEDGVLHMTYLFTKKSVPLDKIGEISYKEDVYTVLDRNGRVLGTINAKLTGIGTVIQALDQNGIRFV